MTGEVKKGKYIYYKCTQYKGKCDNVYVREEKLADLLGQIVLRVKIDEDTVSFVSKALEESHKDKVLFHKEAISSLQNRYNRLQTFLDKGYEDKLSGKISAELWERKSAEWNEEMSRAQVEITKHQSASMSYVQTGIQILELANRAYDLYLAQNNFERRRLLDILLSNCTFYQGTLYPTYRKPFDILAKGLQNQSMRGRRDSNSRPPA